MATGKKPFLKMQCTACKGVNYFTRKTKNVGDKKLELKKFCKVCRKHTLHKERKK
ncbi:MAG: 50S ribosomal protein L33 [Patescibacteria group bacterium]